METADKQKLQQLAQFAKELGVPFVIGGEFGLSLTGDAHCVMDNIEDNIKVRTPEINEKLKALTEIEYNDFMVHLAEAAANSGYGDRISEEMYDNLRNYVMEELESELDDYIARKDHEPSRTSIGEVEHLKWLVYYREDVISADILNEFSYNEDGTLHYDECDWAEYVDIKGVVGVYNGTKEEVLALGSKHSDVPVKHLGVLKLHHTVEDF